MNPPSRQYRTEVKALKKTCDAVFSGPPEQVQDLKYHLVSANLQNLIPAIAAAQHARLIREMYFFQKWAARDQHCTALLDTIQTEGELPDWSQCDSHPAIFCSYHLGSYRLIIPYLVKQGIKLTLLIDANVDRRQRDDFFEVVNAARARYGIVENHFEIVNTETPNVMFTLLRALKKGRSLMIFIDGNTGVDGKSTDADKLQAVRLFDQTVFSRKGLAYLSWSAKVPVIPLVAYRNPHDLWQNRLRFYPPVLASDNLEGGRDAWCAQVLQHLYAILQQQLARICSQWESWRYIEHSMLLPTLPATTRSIDAGQLGATTRLTLNRQRYALFRFDDTQFALFDRSAYHTTLIGQAFMDCLLGFDEGGLLLAQALGLAGMNMGLVVKLLEREVLVANAD